MLLTPYGLLKVIANYNLFLVHLVNNKIEREGAYRANMTQLYEAFINVLDGKRHLVWDSIKQKASRGRTKVHESLHL